MEWCANYERHNRYPLPIWKRFLVGQYQIYQGMEWGDNYSYANADESYMSAFLHFLMVHERMKFPHFGVDLIGYLPKADFKFILYHLSAFTQQFLYWQITNGAAHRKSRFSEKKAALHLQCLMIGLVSQVPASRRSDGIYNASVIMTGVL
jgi:hypothetical protein